MKSHSFALCVLVLATISFSTLAGAAVNRERSFEFTLAGGISSPTDDYEKVAASGRAYNFSLGYTPKTLFTLSVEYGTKNNPYSEQGKYLALHRLGYSIRSAEYESTYMGLSTKFLITDNSVTPYVRIGMAQWNVKSNIETVQSTYNSTNEYTGFLIAFGGQVGIMSHFGGFGELSYSGFHRSGQAQNSDVQFLIGLQFVMPAH